MTAVTERRPIKVLIVDDSLVIRKVLSSQLEKAAGIEVVGTAEDPYVARDKIVALNPDVLTLDIEMPRMDGLSFLERLMQYQPMPVLVLSSLSAEGSDVAIRALELGAVDVVQKPMSADSLVSVTKNLVARIRVAAHARCAPLRARPSPEGRPPAKASAARKKASKRAKPSGSVLAPAQLLNRIVAIGASTGGTEAIKEVLMGLPANAPGTVITQHMPHTFTAAFARRLDSLCAMTVREAVHGEFIEPGLALVAPGGRHLVVRRKGSRHVAEVVGGPPVHHQRPSVDVLFHSVARQVGPEAVGILLTGMGADGARGMLAMRSAGAPTMAQNEATSVVFGMPKEAIDLGAAAEVVPLDRMAGAILRALRVAPVAAPKAQRK